MGQGAGPRLVLGREETGSGPVRLLARHLGNAEQSQGVAASHLSPVTEQPVPPAPDGRGDMFLHMCLCASEFPLWPLISYSEPWGQVRFRFYKGNTVHKLYIMNTLQGSGAAPYIQAH